MKYWFAAALVFLVTAGAGCAVFSRSAKQEASPPSVSATEQVSGLVGVVDVINPTGRVFSLVLPDRSTENVGFGEVDLSGLKSGMLVSVDGTRDRSTRMIAPTSITEAQSSGIRVTSPGIDSTVTSPLVVFGFAKSETGTIHWRVRASSGELRSEGDAPVVAAVPGGFGAFRLDLFLPAMKDLSFSLELSLRDRAGAEAQVVSVPLHLLTDRATTFNVYFSNTSKGSGRDCSLVFPVQRTVAETSAVARAALTELLNGPTASERGQGYSSFLPKDAGVHTLVLDGQIASADFNQPLAVPAGACASANVRAEIAQTLVQFPPVSVIHVTVGGKAVPSLQP